MRLNCHVRSKNEVTVVARQLFLSIFVLITLASCAQNTKLSASPEMINGKDRGSDLLEKAYQSMGGKEALLALQDLYIEDSRDRYLMGQGPEPGVGLFRGITSEAKVSYDLLNEDFRLEFVHANHYRIERNVTELVKDGAAYLMGWDDFYQEKPPGVNKPMKSDRLAVSVKTEKLLNPHLLLKEVIADPSLVLTNPTEPMVFGARLTENEVYPVSFSRDRASGKRVIVTNEKWLDKWHSTKFFEQSILEYEIDSTWLDRWQRSTDAGIAKHERLVIKNDVYPISLIIDSISGHLVQLNTVEYDVVLGDVPVEVFYFDWKQFGDLFFPTHIRMSVAGIPALEVTRRNIEVNKSFNSATFTPPSDVIYQHDEELAFRGARVSQIVQSLAHAGSPEKALGRPHIEANEIEPGVFLLDATPSDVIYVLVVEQANGIVVIEPGFFDLKGEAIIDWISENIPDKPITHIIATHAHMDHAGGVRPYVAAGATLVVHENAKEFFKKVLSRPASKILPDALDRNPRKGEVLAVNAEEPFEIGDETRPVVVYPVENGHTTDMVMVMVENEKVLYSGDLYVGALARYAPAARRISPAKQPTSTIELYDAIQLYQLDVKTLVGAHSKNLVKYEEFEQFMGN
tara:strand:+ start:10294 stop:12180 length:1887 start_codon:yes stop_codon:yes gene_type:complete